MSEQPNKNCPVCQDDSQNLATVILKSISETSLAEFVDIVLHEGLNIDTSCISIVLDDILFERDTDLTDEDE